MHPNQAFRKPSQQRNIAFARARSFGTLAINANDGPLLSHIPFQLSEDGAYIEAHLVRSNPILKHLEQPVPAVISVMGGDAYISPDWYGVENQVPTWNYIAVHLRGRLERLDQAQLHGVLERLSAGMENRITDKRPWKIDKMDTEIYEKMQRQIVPIAIEVDDIQGTWKLSQNKPDEVRHRAVKGVRNTGMGQATEDLAGHMEQVDKD